MKKPFVVGIGNAGKNIAINLADALKTDAMVVGANALSLQQSGLTNTLLLDKNKISGQQSCPSVACLQWVFSGEDSLLLVAGLGGEFATAVLPIMVELAKAMGIPTLIAVSMPLKKEGPEKQKQARACIARIKTHNQNILVFDQETLSTDFANDEKSMFELFRLANQKITEDVIAKLA